MGKPHPIELRKRVVDYVEEGHSHRSAASRFCVSIKFVNDMVKLKRETGALEPKPQGRAGHGKLASVTGWIDRRLRETGDLTIDQLVEEISDQYGIEAHRVSVWRRIRSLDLTHKKSPARG